jgi:hypothetical protein
MTTYKGSCHCGNVRYEVSMELKQAMECNCSHCSRKGFLLTFVPPEQFTLLSGEEKLRAYHFNKKRIDHLFCVDCGVESFARGKKSDGSAMIAVNVRCLEGVDPKTVDIKHVDGRSF